MIKSKDFHFGGIVLEEMMKGNVADALLIVYIFGQYRKQICDIMHGYKDGKYTRNDFKPFRKYSGLCCCSRYT